MQRDPMDPHVQPQWDDSLQTALETAIGYLNYSSGAPDVRFLAGIDRLYAFVGSTFRGGAGSPPDEEGAGEPTQQQRGSAVLPTGITKGETTVTRLELLLQWGIARLQGSSEAFRCTEQAERVLRLVFSEVLPAYARFHKDLLFHQPEEDLFQPFFIGRVAEAVLAEGPPWDQTQRIVEGALKRLNDFVGHRPVPVLRTEQKIQPYAHERVRPIPLYIRGAGVASGRYRDLIETALSILAKTERHLLSEASFDPDLLEELALDPRAYDFDHPVNRRPNYLFGQWDPHVIDNRGRYRRYVLQQVTLEGMLARLAAPGKLAAEELLYEAGAVLAGTILMGAGISGAGPETHDSSTTLATLLPRIADYRDRFYDRLLAETPGKHGRRLAAEAKRLRQPFGGARQHLNQELVRRRADQVQHVHLAQLFARMGYAEAARRHAHVVPVTSARMKCEISCRLSAAHLHVDRGQLDAAAAALPEIEDLLHRAIECGALVDPWNILGFGGQFSLFPTPENSTIDHRVDELVELVGEIFELYARLQKAAAAAGQMRLQETLAEDLARLASWWDRFATTEVADVESVSGHEAWESAEHVARALRAWHNAGTAAGDVAFWREHVEHFHSAKAYALVVEALLDQGDLVSSMALLMHWLSQADELSLTDARYAFHPLALRWMVELWREDEPAGSGRSPTHVTAEERWAMTTKFLDYLEASAESYWQVPKLDEAGPFGRGGVVEPDTSRLLDEEEDDEEDVFGAAYENVTYRDSADDGFEGEMIEGGYAAGDFELAAEVERLGKRLVFHRMLARIWRQAAAASARLAPEAPGREEALVAWLGQAARNRRDLVDLMEAIYRYEIRPLGSSHESMVEYDRRQAIKDALIERVLATCLETVEAARLVHAVLREEVELPGAAEWELAVQRGLRAMLSGDVEGLRKQWKGMIKAIAKEPLLYVPTRFGGNPRRIAAARSIHRAFHLLLTYLPRLGLLAETVEFIELAKSMERRHPVGRGAITEFDDLFQCGLQAIAQCIAASVPRHEGGGSSPADDETLVELLETAVEPLLHRWLEHSRNIRLSVMEPLSNETDFRRLRRFIESYGHDIFTQHFMNLGNLRAILHQGTDRFLAQLQEDPQAAEEFRLVADLDRKISRDQAAEILEDILEAVVENYEEYIDYNSTTTQSDRGEMLFTLLDFLRLLASYDRVAWNLHPLVLVHAVLVETGRTTAAALWREAMAQRTESIADQHWQRFEKLNQRYGMRLPTVADRLSERFVRPLIVDRLRALIRPAIDELRSGGPTPSFASLEKGIAELTREPLGLGYDVPTWLEVLENEMEEIWSRSAEGEAADPLPQIPQVAIPIAELRREMRRWSRRRLR